MEIKQIEKKISAVVEFEKFLYSFLKSMPIDSFNGATRLILNIRNREKEVLIKLILKCKSKVDRISDLTCISYGGVFVTKWYLLPSCSRN
jgi:hypothetical protein